MGDSSIAAVLSGAARWHVECGDNRAAMAAMPENSIDAVVTDPPYELNFMAGVTRGWDATGIAFDPEFWAAVLRVMKPGASLLSFGATRNNHRVVCAIEDAGFEIRDEMCDWIYGTGFPHGENIARNVEMFLCSLPGRHCDKRLPPEARRLPGDHLCPTGDPRADEYRGMRTALKPAREPITVARKPLDGTLAANALAWHVAGYNVRAAAIPRGEVEPATGDPDEIVGGWPANVILEHAPDCGPRCVDGCPVAVLNAQSGETASMGSSTGQEPSVRTQNTYGAMERTPWTAYGDRGGAGRFFYVVKPDGFERDFGCDDLPDRGIVEAIGRNGENHGRHSPSAGAGRGGEPRKNHHPTVKPWDLMKHLCLLACPPTGVVFDPFCGSGSTGCGAMLAGVRFLGAELSAEYVDIARARIGAVQNLKERPELVRERGAPKAQMGLFNGSKGAGA